MWCDAPMFENDLFLYENLAAFLANTSKISHKPPCQRFS